MKTTAKVKMVGLVLALVLCYFYPAAVSADTGVATGVAAQSGGAGAAANLDFQITIPSFIVFRVGTAGSIDTIQFNPAAADIAAGTAGIAGTGGDAGNGIVNVSLISNDGLVTITEGNNSAGAGLGNGVPSQFISYGQINTADSGAGGIAPPTLSDGGGNGSAIAATVGTITARTSTWTYTYNNPATPPAPGTYGGAGNGGRVTYTAAIP